MIDTIRPIVVWCPFCGGPAERRRDSRGDEVIVCCAYYPCHPARVRTAQDGELEQFWRDLLGPNYWTERRHGE